MGSPRQYADGMRFGTWTILDAYPVDGKSQYARCRCDCGALRSIFRPFLRHGYIVRSGRQRHTPRCQVCSSAKRQPIALLGLSFGPRTVIEVDGTMVVLRCSVCTHASILDRLTVMTMRRTKTHGSCSHCSVIASAAAITATGVSRQAIMSRIAHGWTREEATTLSRGQMPERFRAGPRPRAATSAKRPENWGLAAAQSRAAGVSPGTYHSRRRLGYTHEQALTGDGVRPRGRPRRGAPRDA